jgi:hypothetical protein
MQSQHICSCGYISYIQFFVVFSDGVVPRSDRRCYQSSVDSVDAHGHNCWFRRLLPNTRAGVLLEEGEVISDVMDISA